jgi:hypothetical protein
MADWVGIAETTIRDYIRDVENDIMRNRKILALLQSRGRITFNHSGTDMDWKIRYKRAIPKGYADMDTQSFPRRNRHKTATLGYRGYSLSESISKLDKLKNRGTPAIVKILETKVTSMTEDFEEFMGDEFYIDGNATGNGKRIHGIESFLGAGSASTLAPIALPSDSYAGLNTDLGSYGGSWSASGTTSTAASRCGRRRRQRRVGLLLAAAGGLPVGQQRHRRLGGVLPRRGRTPAWRRCGTASSTAARTSPPAASSTPIDAQRRAVPPVRGGARRQGAIVVQQGNGKSNTTLTGLGYSDVVNYEGCEVTYEYGMPVNTGYGWNIDQMEFRSMQDRLIVPEGPFENEVDKTVRFSLDFFGNLVFRPRYFVKWKNFTP